MTMSCAIIKKFIIFICIFCINFLIIYSSNITKEEVKISGGYKGGKWVKYIVSIRKQRKELQRYGTGHYCAGSILTEYIILSAAHCFEKVPHYDPPLLVVTGSSYRLKRTESTQVIKVAQIIAHPNYDPVKVIHDIALVKLLHALNVDDKHTGIIKLPRKPPYEGLKCTAAGWGNIYYKGPKPDLIVYADIQLTSDEECQNSFPDITDKQICALDSQDIVKDTCQADSGGPLFCSNAVYGITSFGEPCGKLNKGGVYTNVYKYTNWILRNTGPTKSIPKLLHFVCLYIYFVYNSWAISFLSF